MRLPITIWAFIIPASAYFIYWAGMRISYVWQTRMFMSFPKIDELLYCLFYYGSLGVVFVLLVHSLFCSNKLAVLLCLAAIALGSLDAMPNSKDEYEKRNSDKIIGKFGYMVSRMHPYKAKDAPLPPSAKDQAILAPGKSVTATENESGMKMTITAGEGSMRIFTWDGVTRSLDVVQEKDYLGFPERTGQPEDYRYIWEDHKGVKRCTYWEQIHYFDSEDELKKWVTEQKNGDWQMTENEGGILASFSTQCEENAIVVLVSKGMIKK